METNAQYFDCLCRTCMNKVEASSHDGTTKTKQQWLSIFDTIEECDGFRVAELLSDAVPQIVAQPSDELPKKICNECLQRLLSVYWFQQMCLQSDKEMHELLSKKNTVLKTPMLVETIKCKTETNAADSQPLQELSCISSLQNLQQSSIQESLAEVTVQTIEPEAAESSADDHLQDNTHLLEHFSDWQDELEELIKNEPIEDDAANSEYSDGDTMHSIISVAKDEVLPIEFEDQQVNGASSRHNCHLCNNSYKKHDCDSCNKSYTSSYKLRRHMLTHTDVRPNVSSECGKSFSTKSSLGVQRTNDGDKPYECPYCPQKFKSKGNVSKHKKIHEGAAKRHECDICGKKFRLSGDLKKHKRIHSNEKPYKCDLCEKRFTNMQPLKNHIRTHTGEKPYKCEYCERRFTSHCILGKHLRRHLGKNMHRCKFCPLAFPLAAEMRLHLTSHKNEDPETRERNLKALQEEEVKLKLKFSKEKN